MTQNVACCLNKMEGQQAIGQPPVGYSRTWPGRRWGQPASDDYLLNTDVYHHIWISWSDNTFNILVYVSESELPILFFAVRQVASMLNIYFQVHMTVECNEYDPVHVIDVVDGL